MLKRCLKSLQANKNIVTGRKEQQFYALINTAPNDGKVSTFVVGGNSRIDAELNAKEMLKEYKGSHIAGIYPVR